MHTVSMYALKIYDLGLLRTVVSIAVCKGKFVILYSVILINKLKHIVKISKLLSLVKCALIC